MRTPWLIGTSSIALGIFLSIVLLFGNLNPFNFAFEAPITITNGSGRDISVTPIGVAEGSGALYPLPQYAFLSPVFPAVRQGRFKLRNGAALEIRYDWDDIIFSSVVIETPGSNPRELIIEPNAKVEDCCYVPSGLTPHITGLDHLPEARPEAIRAVEQHSLNFWALLLWLPVLGPVLLLVGCLLLARNFFSGFALLQAMPNSAMDSDTEPHSTLAVFMATREPEPPEELDAGTDLNLKRNAPFRIVDRWTTRQHVIFLAAGVVSSLVLAYFFWPTR